MLGIRAGKKLGLGWFLYSDQNFIPEPCSDYKSYALTVWPDSDPNVRCMDPVVWMSEFRMWFVNILTEILCDRIQTRTRIRIRFFNVLTRLSKIILIKFSGEFRPKLHINLVVCCSNPVDRLSEFVRTRNGSKIRTTRTRICRLEFKFGHVWLKFPQRFCDLGGTDFCQPYLQLVTGHWYSYVADLRVGSVECHVR